ncbi:MAG: GNAT family N-acetyltransferase [Planctomycetota bacterium]
MSDGILARVDGASATQGLQALRPLASRVSIDIRPATEADFPWIDALQKKNTHALGFMRRDWILGRIAKGEVLIAYVGGEMSDVRCPNAGAVGLDAADISHPTSDINHVPVGYVIGADRYMSQDPVGLIYQLCVAPEFRGQLVAATLLKAFMERCAYGTRLMSCWCRQDLVANEFWEAMGFVPIAFRASGRSTVQRLRKQAKKEAEARGEVWDADAPVVGGVQIWWQRRVRVGDERTEYWFPPETRAGAMGEVRLSFPIPPEVSWREVMPVVLPGSGEREARLLALEDAVKAADAALRSPRSKKGGGERGPSKRDADQATGPSPRAVKTLAVSGFGVGASPEPEVQRDEQREAAAREAEAAERAAEREAREAQKRAALEALKAERRKNDPAMVAMARELRDKWQEQSAQGGLVAGWLAERSAGKYDVGRVLADGARGAAENSDGPQRLAA